MQDKIKNIAWFFFPFFVLVFLWELIVFSGLLSVELLPHPSSVFLSFVDMLYEGKIQLHIFESLYRMVLGYIIGSLVGVSVGLLMGSNKYLSQTFTPIFSLLVSIPTIAWVPALLVVTGLGDTTIIISVFLGSFFAIVYNTMNGLRSVKKNLVDAARTMGTDRKNIFLHVLLPGSMVSIIPGLRLGIGYSWRALVGAEMLASKTGGLGKLIYGARSYGGVTEMIIGLILIGILSFLMDRFIMSKVEEKTIEKWGMIKKRR